MATADDFDFVGEGWIMWRAYDQAVRTELTSNAVRGSSGEWILIDPIALAPAARAALGPAHPPAAIVLTNGNHVRAAESWRREFRLPVFAHLDAAADAPVVVDRVLQEGDLVAGNLRVLEMPGAGAGEIALLRGDAHPLMVVGDLLVNLESHPCQILPAKYCREVKSARASVRRLATERFDALGFAHGDPIRTGAGARVTGLLDALR